MPCARARRRPHGRVEPPAGRPRRFRKGTRMEQQGRTAMAEEPQKAEPSAGPALKPQKVPAKLLPHQVMGLSYYMERLYPGDKVQRFLEIFAAVLQHSNYAQLVDTYARTGRQMRQLRRPPARSTSPPGSPRTSPATGRTCSWKSTGATSRSAASSRASSRGASI